MISEYRGRSSLWFVALNDIKTNSNDRLRRSNSEILETDQVIEDGGEFTISLESFYVQGKYDSGSTNDLLVRSWVKYGNDKQLEVINFFREDVAFKSTLDDLKWEHIFSVQDYSEQDRVHLEIEITEVDRNISSTDKVIDNLQVLSDRFGAAFSVIAPYAKLGSTAMKGIKRLHFLRSRDQAIFRSSFDLYGVGGTGETPLRAGAYILFDEKAGGLDVEGSKYKLSGLKLMNADPHEASKDIPDDYVVLKIEPFLVHSGQGQNAEEILENQQLAAVLEAMTTDESDEGRQADIQLLQDLIRDAKTLKDLNYYQSLKAKKTRNEALTESQEKRFAALGKHLGQYLS